MAAKTMAVSTTALVAVFAVLFVAVSAQSPTPDCTAAMSTLLTCVTYVTGPGSTPPAACCQGLTSLNTNNPVCLCQLITAQLNSSTAGVNVTKAYSLTKDCNVTIDTKTCPALAHLSAPPSGSPAAPPPGVVAPSPPPTSPPVSGGPSTSPTPVSGGPGPSPGGGVGSPSSPGGPGSGSTGSGSTFRPSFWVVLSTVALISAEIVLRML